MIPLDSPRWQELRDAYGPAGHIADALRRLSAGSDSAWRDLYDAFALVSRGEISEAAFAAVPHVAAIASEQTLDDRYPHLVFASRVAYTGLANCSWMAADVLSPCLAAFERLSASAQELLPTLDEDSAVEIAKAIVGLENCPAMYDVLDALWHGEVPVRCPADACGVELWLVPRDGGLACTIAREPDEDDASAECAVVPRALPVDEGGPWTDANALARIVALASGDVARVLAALAGSTTCPTCEERFDVLKELLDPTDF